MRRTLIEHDLRRFDDPVADVCALRPSQDHHDVAAGHAVHGDADQRQRRDFRRRVREIEGRHRGGLALVLTAHTIECRAPLVAARGMRSLLFGIAPSDPITFVDV